MEIQWKEAIGAADESELHRKVARLEEENAMAG